MAKKVQSYKVVLNIATVPDNYIRMTLTCYQKYLVGWNVNNGYVCLYFPPNPDTYNLLNQVAEITNEIYTSFLDPDPVILSSIKAYQKDATQKSDSST